MLLVDLLRQGPVLTQDELAAALSDAGEPVTQATISRDLSAIGAVRGAGGYQLPDAVGSVAVAGQDELAAVVRRHAVSAVAAHSIVVVRTAPGHAQMVAAAFDRWPPDPVAGTVAGDDTIFLATSGPGAAHELADELNAAIAGNA